MSGQTLYRFFDNTGQLLYVGITKNGFHRWCEHQLMQEWWSQVVTGTVEHFDTREEVVRAEQEAIVRERPRFNVTHSVRPEHVARWKARATRHGDEPSTFAPRYTPEGLEQIRVDAERRARARRLDRYDDGLSWPRRLMDKITADVDRDVPVEVARELVRMSDPDSDWVRTLRRLGRMCDVEWSEEQPERTPVTIAIAEGVRQHAAERAAKRQERARAG